MYDDDDTAGILAESHAGGGFSVERMKGRSLYLRSAGPGFSSVSHSMSSTNLRSIGHEARQGKVICSMGPDDTIRHRSYGGKGQDGKTPGRLTACGRWRNLGITTSCDRVQHSSFPILPSRRPLLCPLDCGLSGIAMLSNPFSRSGQFPGQGPLRGSSSVLNSQSY